MRSHKRATIRRVRLLSDDCNHSHDLVYAGCTSVSPGFCTFTQVAAVLRGRSQMHGQHERGVSHQVRLLCSWYIMPALRL